MNSYISLRITVVIVMVSSLSLPEHLDNLGDTLEGPVSNQVEMMLKEDKTSVEGKQKLKCSGIPTTNNNINLMLRLNLCMLVASRRLFQLSHCFDGEQTRLLQSLLHSVSPTALGTLWAGLCLCWTRTGDVDWLPLPYLLLDEGWALSSGQATRQTQV